MDSIGIVGHGLYLPERRISAAEIAAATGGRWSERAVRDKLGFDRKPVPGPADGTQEMGARAALDALARTGVEPGDVDLILCIGEEWKEYPLTTSGIYIQERIGAANAWSIDLQQRCNSTIAALKIARDLMRSDRDLETVMIVGGYRNGDLVDYRDPAVSFLYNLGAGAGALILRRGHRENQVLGSHIITDGSMARDIGVAYGGTEQPIERLPDRELDALRERGNRSLRLFDADHMKQRLNQVSMANWYRCIDRCLEKSGASRAEIGFLNMPHIKRSMFLAMLDELGLAEDQSFYPRDYGHVGQIDPIIAIDEGLRLGRLRAGDLMVMVAAGIGYVWGAIAVQWGPATAAAR
jgi:3-oxoacyl-[acyl-carrier-protein] synthase-3